MRGIVRLPVGLAATLFTIMLACSACATALDPSLDVSQYAHTTWRIRDGFAKGISTSLAQAPDGYMWLGTESGLLRFDGVRVVQWQPPVGQQLPGTLITALLTAREGTLWIGTFTGLASWKEGKLTQIPELSSRNIQSLLEAHDGTIWIGTYDDSGSRLCNVRMGVVQCEALEPGIEALYEDSKGTLWVGERKGIWRWKPGTPEFYPMQNEPLGISGFGEDEQGNLLFGSHAGIRRLVEHQTEPYPTPGSLSRCQITRMFRDHDGSLWAGTSECGLLHIHEGKTDVFSHVNGLSDDYVTRIVEDREGNIWVATYGGIDRFRSYAVPTISSNEGLPNTSWSVLASKDGTVWVANNKGLSLWKNGKVSLFGSRGGTQKSDGKLNGQLPVALFQDSGGRIWVSSAGGLGYLQDDRFVAVPGFPGRVVYSMAEIPSGHLWASDRDAGLFQLSDGRLTQQIPWAQLGRRDFAKTIVADPSERGLWLGFQKGGIAYFTDGRIRKSYSTADGLGEGEVTDLRFGSRGALWAATSKGLSRIKDGQVTTLTRKNGLPCDKVVATMEDNDHSMWIYLACGLVRVTQAELDGWVADPNKVLNTTLFEASDGVRSHAAAGGFEPHMTKTTDGRILFLPWDGVSVIDPNHIPFNKLPPPVHIEQITVDGKTYDPANGLRLPPHVRDLTIGYTALSLVVPEKIHFRYKLEGQDPDWREVVNDRQVQYSNLAPRHYIFRVMACNNSGVWNQEGASLNFVIPPAWYQTTWFKVVFVVVFLTMLWGIYELRVRQLAAQFNMRLDERVSERTRIARELHDTLLQNFQGLLPRLQAALYMLPERVTEARKTLEAALDKASEAITEGRDAVKALRLSTVEKNDLAVAIRTLGEELAVTTANQSSPTFEVAVQGTPRSLHPILRDEVYRLAAEAMRNAFCHAQAQKIEVEIRYGEREFGMQIRDDGRGIDPSVLSGDGREGHFGLHGMHERAKIVGGKLKVWSELNSGTEVELSIPALRAYTQPPRSLRLLQKLSGKDKQRQERV
jgi:signal transduction histidine kinase/ligand-binding sensor domain-containing protein